MPRAAEVALPRAELLRPVKAPSKVAPMEMAVWKPACAGLLLLPRHGLFRFALALL